MTEPHTHTRTDINIKPGLIIVRVTISDSRGQKCVLGPNMSKIRSVVWAVGGGCPYFLTPHIQFRALLYRLQGDTKRLAFHNLCLRNTERKELDSPVFASHLLHLLQGLALIFENEADSLPQLPFGYGFEGVGIFQLLQVGGGLPPAAALEDGSLGVGERLESESVVDENHVLRSLHGNVQELRILDGIVQTRMSVSGMKRWVFFSDTWSPCLSTEPRRTVH